MPSTFHKQMRIKKLFVSTPNTCFYLRICSLLFLTALLILPCACSGTKVPSEEPSFSAFLNEFFQDYATTDSLSLHYTVADPEGLKIEPQPVSLGHFSEEALRETNQTTRDYLNRLYNFSRDSLNDSDRLTYDLLEYALGNSVNTEQTLLYNSPLGPSTGLQTQLPILLAEYRFSCIEDVENYFLLLEDLPRYFSELCTFEEARSAAGTQACEEVLSRILLQCNSFVEDPGNNFLIESFRDRLTALPALSSTQIADLCIRNQKLVFTKVIPAYETLIETLEKLIDPSIPATGLASYPDGAAYYETLVRSNTGSDKNMAELEQMLEDALAKNMLTMMTLYESEALRTELEHYQSYGLTAKPEVDSAIPNIPSSASIPDVQNTPASTEYSSSLLLRLQEQICTDFPLPAEATFRVENIHPSLEDFISPALYLVPPFDNYTENVIYINRSKCTTESLFSTLAHEGYPGHLYQNTYFSATSPHPVRMLLNFTGYDEGWGTYAELYAYQYADCSEELRHFLVAEQVAGLCVYSLSDIRIHYHGEDLTSITGFLQKYGFSEDSAEEIFYTQLAEPGIYLPYSVGYLEFCNLRDLYRSMEGADATLLTFHTFLLKTGPAPFSILEELLTEKFSQN